MIYLDSAAAVKLAYAEPESAALRRWLDERAETGWISSVVTEIEAFRALARHAPGAVSRLPAVLDQIDLIRWHRGGPGRAERSRVLEVFASAHSMSVAQMPRREPADGEPRLERT